jgi:hypothetical protein
VAAEGWFTITRALPPRIDGSPRLRFVFGITMANRDRSLLVELRELLRFGSIIDASPAQDGWQPTSTLSISSRKGHFAATVPFMDEFLVPPARKRTQFEHWRSALVAYDVERPRTVGRSMCSQPDCDRPVRGRGLCRSHYYRATGY